MEQVLAKLDTILARLDKLEHAHAGGGGGGAAPAPAAAGSGDAAPTVAAFQALVDAHLGTFQALSAKIGGEVAAIAPLVMTCVEQQKALIAEAARSKKPDAGAMAAVLKPLSDSITAVTDFQGKSRSAKDKNNVFGVGEGIGIFGWVAVEPTPGPYASEMMGASKFYLDKVLREFKGKDEDQVNWTNAYTSFLADLIKYIKQYHTTGLAWNPRGGAAQAPSASAAAKPAAAAPAAAKPAAAASPAKPAAAAAAGKPAAGGAGAPMLFAELNKGGAITSGLKKVAREETNKGKQISGKVETKETGPAKAAAPAKPPKCELKENKWVVEYQFYPTAPVVISGIEKNHTVYIYKCEGAVIQIDGKCNSIAMDGCKKTGLVFEEVVSTCEVINCQSVKVQCKTKVPALAIDKTHGIQVFIPKSSLETEIVSGTSSEMNVVFPNPSGKDEDDPIELPIPEQFKSVYSKGKLVSNQVDHSGG